jgi:DNA polymerase-3 subunit alpha
VQEDGIVVVAGRLDHRGEEVKVMARELRELQLKTDGRLQIDVPATRLSPGLVARLKEVLASHPGSAPVFLHMVSGSNHKVLKLSDAYRVELRSALYAELRELLGPRAVA